MPIDMLVDKARDERTQDGPDERRSGENPARISIPARTSSSENVYDLHHCSERPSAQLCISDAGLGDSRPDFFVPKDVGDGSS